MHIPALYKVMGGAGRGFKDYILYMEKKLLRDQYCTVRVDMCLRNISVPLNKMPFLQCLAFLKGRTHTLLILPKIFI